MFLENPRSIPKPFTILNNENLRPTHVDYLGMAVVKEGILLPEMGIDTPIIMLGDLLAGLL